MMSLLRPARPSRRCTSIQTLLAMGTALGLASASGQALAQDSTMSIRATPNVLYAGQSASVDALAHFPSNIYAFASTQFNVHATTPAWSFASSGLIAGPSVLGMNVWQSHSPQAGVFANPANPYRVWRGVFTPTTRDPALIEITADPSAIALYPSRLTSSWIAGNVKGDSDWILVNPLKVGKWLAAPGPGTRAHTCCDDVIVDGQIITAESHAGAVRIGLLLPAVQSVRESEVALRFSGRPETFTVGVDLPGSPREELSLNYTKVNWSHANNAEMYELSANLGDAAGGAIAFEGFRGGISVAAGTLGEDGCGLWVDRVPDRIGASVRPSRQQGELEPYRTIKVQDILVSSWSTTGHGSARLIGPNGLAIEVDQVTLRSSRPISANNLRQLGLGCHVIEATGVQSISILPSQPTR